MKPFSRAMLLFLIGGVILSFVPSYSVAVDLESNPRFIHHRVEIKAFEFVPKNIKVAPGDIVTWVNNDIVPHHVINSADKQPLSPALAAGEQSSYTVSKAGDYFCGFHPSMNGRISY